MVRQPLCASAPAAFRALEAVLSETYRFIAIDVETANSDASSICQIGLACVGETGVEEVVTLLIDPRCHFAGMNIQIHGKPIDPDGESDNDAF